MPRRDELSAAIKGLRETDPDISVSEIARRLGIPASTARKYAQRLGLRTVTAKSFDPQRKRRLLPLPTQAIGRIANNARGGASELIAAAHFMRLGYEVFWALHPTASCDFVMQKNGRIERVEVKTGWRLGNGSVRFNVPRLKKCNDYDVLAVVVPGEVAIHTFHPAGRRDVRVTPD